METSIDENVLAEVITAITGNITIESDSSDDSDYSSTVSDSINESEYGCEHYKRHCLLRAKCCNKTFPCRFCHDDAMNNYKLPIEDQHTMNRFDVEYIVCTECDLEQPVQATCEGCDIVFGEYFCAICRLFDDVDKGQWHCEDCGLCRVGKDKQSWVHCKTCETCVTDEHECKGNSMKNNCPICMEEMFTSTQPTVYAKCGHWMHTKCLHEFAQTNYKCPLCRKSIVDISVWNQLMDMEVANTPMPEEYKDKTIDILCNECRIESTVKFHIVGLKCLDCGSYNTQKI